MQPADLKVLLLQTMQAPVEGVSDLQVVVGLFAPGPRVIK
jgi:hypothetical protein